MSRDAVVVGNLSIAVTDRQKMDEWTHIALERVNVANKSPGGRRTNHRDHESIMHRWEIERDSFISNQEELLDNSLR